MKIDEKVYNRDWFHQKYTVEKLTTREIADIIGCSHGAVYKKLIKFGLVEQEKVDKSRQVDKKLTPEPEKVTPTEEKKTIYLYTFGAKTFYVDPHSPEQQKKAREFRVQVTAENIVDALRRAEIEVRKQSNDFEFSLMVLYGSTVTIFPPRKRE